MTKITIRYKIFIGYGNNLTKVFTSAARVYTELKEEVISDGNQLEALDEASL